MRGGIIRPALIALGFVALVGLWPVARSPIPGHYINAASGSFTLMNAQTRQGVGLSTLAASSDDGSGRYVFQFSCRTSAGAATDGCSVALQLSNDSGTTWSGLYSFRGADDVYSVPTCGSCQLRAFAFVADSEHRATVVTTASGATTAAAPTYTATATPTRTPTPH